MANYRHQYIIGDLHGCYRAFNDLLKHIDFDVKYDHLYLCGDIVARGEDSLATLRQAKALSDQGALSSVLGNHDITLIANWLGVLPPKAKDKTLPILTANDCNELLDWLRHRPLYLLPDDNSIIVHAGIPHIWTDKEAMMYADEVHQILRGNIYILNQILPKLYKKSNKKTWSKTLKDTKRLRMIVNYLTRMRTIDHYGILEFDYTDNPSIRQPEAPYRAWYDHLTQSTRRIYFGHWSALMAQVDRVCMRSLDGGAVWGGTLVAYRLQDHKVFYIKSQRDSS